MRNSKRMMSRQICAIDVCEILRLVFHARSVDVGGFAVTSHRDDSRAISLAFHAGHVIAASCSTLGHEELLSQKLRETVARSHGSLFIFCAYTCTQCRECAITFASAFILLREPDCETSMLDVECLDRRSLVEIAISTPRAPDASRINVNSMDPERSDQLETRMSSTAAALFDGQSRRGPGVRDAHESRRDTNSRIIN